MVDFERLSMTLLGEGGLDDEPALVEEVDELLHKAARLVSEPGFDGPAKITITIAVAAHGPSGVTVEHAVKFAEPRRKRRGMAAIIDDQGNMLAQSHKQEPLPLMGGVAVLDEARNGGTK